MELMIEVPECIRLDVEKRVNELHQKGTIFHNIIQSLSFKELGLTTEDLDIVKDPRILFRVRVNAALINNPYKMSSNRSLDPNLVKTYFRITKQIGFDHKGSGGIKGNLNIEELSLLIKELEEVSSKLKGSIHISRRTYYNHYLPLSG